jgi:hypothetical protein
MVGDRVQGVSGGTVKVTKGIRRDDGHFARTVDGNR